MAKGKSKSRQVGSWTRSVSQSGNVWYKQGSLTLSKKEYDAVQRMTKDMQKQHQQMETMKGYTFSAIEKGITNVQTLKNMSFKDRKDFNKQIYGVKNKKGEVIHAGLKDKRGAWNKHMKEYVGDYKKRALTELEGWGKDSKTYKFIKNMSNVHMKGFMRFYNGTSLFMALYEGQKLGYTDEEMYNNLESQFNGMLRGD